MRRQSSYSWHLNWMSFAMCILVGASDSRLGCWWVMIDVKTLASSQLILSTSSPIVDVLSRGWRQCVVLQHITCMILDNLHTLATEEGAVMEMCITRIRNMQSVLNLNIRFIGLGYFSSAAHHIGEWIGAFQVFNVHSSTH